MKSKKTRIIFSEDVRRAYQALKRLDAIDRTSILRWFCSFCGADIPPGKGPCHNSAGRASNAAVRLREAQERDAALDEEARLREIAEEEASGE